MSLEVFKYVLRHQKAFLFGPFIIAAMIIGCGALFAYAIGASSAGLFLVISTIGMLIIVWGIFVVLSESKYVEVKRRESTKVQG